MHVCRRWRQVIFESPRRLNLQILCTDRTPVQKNIGIWPAFPIIVSYDWLGSNQPEGFGDTIAALRHPDRVCYVTLMAMGSQLAKVVTVMQEPFPVLTRLKIISYKKTAVLPAQFLAGTAPCLQHILLLGVPFPTLPSLLLSTRDLVTLDLNSVPATGYISPEAMVEGLATLTKLETLIIRFESATPSPKQIRPSSINRIVLPALTYLSFEGAWEYLDDFVAQIDSPQLDRIWVTYLNHLANVSAVQLSEFVDRSVGPKLTKFGHARVGYYDCLFSFIMNRLPLHKYCPRPDRPLGIISFRGSDRVSDLAQLLGQFSRAEILSNVAHLNLDYLPDSVYRLDSLEGADNVTWPRLLRPFSAVQTLRVSRELAGIVAHALEDIAGQMVTKVLPSLKSICLQGQSASSIGKFVADRGILIDSL